MSDFLERLNDRSVPFNNRCKFALSVLESSDLSKIFFPRKYQSIFDWLVSFLSKLAKSNDPRVDVFLDRDVWGLLYHFGLVLKEDENPALKQKKLRLLTRPSDFTFAFDEKLFSTRASLLPIIGKTLELASTFGSNVDLEFYQLITNCVIAFFEQNSSPLIVNLTQVTEFINALTRSSSNLVEFNIFLKIFKSSMSILSEVVTSQANYKKSFPQIITAFMSFSKSLDLNDPLIRKVFLDSVINCIFRDENIGDLLTFLVTPQMTAFLNQDDNESFDKFFHKSSSFQKFLFSSLLSDSCVAASIGPILFEAFILKCGSRVDRFNGFNLFTFLIKANNFDLSSSSLLIELLQAQGNKIYQQRNDEIFASNSKFISNIFNLAVGKLDVEADDRVFDLLSSLTRLDFYIVLEKFENFLVVVKKRGAVTRCILEFITGIFRTSVEAREIVVILEKYKAVLEKSDGRFSLESSEKFRSSLRHIFKNVPIQNSLQIYDFFYNSLVENVTVGFAYLFESFIWSLDKICDVIPETKSIPSLHDLLARLSCQTNASVEEKSAFLSILATLIEASPDPKFISKNFDWRAYETEFFENDSLKVGFLKVILSLVLKNIPIDFCSSYSITDFVARLVSEIDDEKYFKIIIKFLPKIAGSFNAVHADRVCKKLLNFFQIDCTILKTVEFYEIIPLQLHFLNALVGEIETDKKASDYVLYLPADYIPDDLAVSLVLALLKIQSQCNIYPHIAWILDSERFREAPAKKLLNSKDFVDFLKMNYSQSDLFGKITSIEGLPWNTLKSLLSNFYTLNSFCEKLSYISKFLVYGEFSENACSKQLVEAIEGLNLEDELSKNPLDIETIDNLDVVLSWVITFSPELVASCLLTVEKYSHTADKVLRARLHCLKCKFPANPDSDFIFETYAINQGLEVGHPITIKLGKDFVALLKNFSIDKFSKDYSRMVAMFLKDDCDFMTRLMFLSISTHLFQTPTHSSIVFTNLMANIENFIKISLTLSPDIRLKVVILLKATGQIKKSVQWDLVVVSKFLHAISLLYQISAIGFSDDPKVVEETLIECYGIYRSLVAKNWKKVQRVGSLGILVLIEMLESLGDGGDLSVIGIDARKRLIGGFCRIISDIGSMRRENVEPFNLLPLIYKFSCVTFPATLRRPIQLSIFSLLDHLTTPASAGLLSRMGNLITLTEPKIILKNLLDEHGKFFKYSGQI